MFVNVVIPKETQAHERRVALVPAVVPKLSKLGAKLQMQAGRVVLELATVKNGRSEAAARRVPVPA